MAQRDAYICDVIVIPTDQAAENLEGLLATLRQNGLEVREIHADQTAIEGTIDAGKIRGMEALAEVEYVRCVYSYIADFPDDDPRNVSEVKPN